MSDSKYNKGDKILLQILPYGGVNIFNPEVQQMVSGNYLEVEVVGIKKAKVVLE